MQTNDCCGGGNSSCGLIIHFTSEARNRSLDASRNSADASPAVGPLRMGENSIYKLIGAQAASERASSPLEKERPRLVRGGENSASQRAAEGNKMEAADDN